MKKEEIKEIGDFCHEKYLGCTLEKGIWHYSYKDEVINMIEEYYKQKKKQI